MSEQRKCELCGAKAVLQQNQRWVCLPCLEAGWKRLGKLLDALGGEQSE